MTSNQLFMAAITSYLNSSVYVVHIAVHWQIFERAAFFSVLAADITNLKFHDLPKIPRELERA